MFMFIDFYWRLLAFDMFFQLCHAPFHLHKCSRCLSHGLCAGFRTLWGHDWNDQVACHVEQAHRTTNGTANMQFPTSNIVQHLNLFSWECGCFCSLTKRTVNQISEAPSKCTMRPWKGFAWAPLNTSANKYRYRGLNNYSLYKLRMALPKGIPGQTARLISSRGWSRWKSAKRPPPLRSCVALISALASALVTKVCAKSAHTLFRPIPVTTVNEMKRRIQGKSTTLN